ncbi:phenylalanine--tRNA ligase subunit beta [Oscillospiraceae bacterium OttesenSCG-928-F05]|nr:phenylalanine--tRNA ligase subunit beta [Oscillospiraceae bacterium OttesenSCG-928-F05]
MKISRKTLESYVSLTGISDKAFADAMTMAGQKIDMVERLDAEIENVVVGNLLSVTAHPNADKLVICSVDVGAEAPVQIVTGAKNVKAGDVVPVALDGSKLPGDVTIKTSEMRGELSCGMLCSFQELGLTQGDVPYADSEGILVFREDLTPGADIRPVLGLDDTVFDFEITPNRADCYSVIGIAREAAAVFGRELTLPSAKFAEAGGNIADHLSVDVRDHDLCPRYMARVVKNVKIAPSPAWVRQRLHAAGLRPINNIVDITNLIMLEYGQPMHAFDYGYIGGGKIVVRRSEEGEILETLDGKQRALRPGMLVIADETKPVGLAGVMGGANSEILDTSETVVFESANFNSASIRRTAAALGMRTDSSGLYEKGLDPANTEAALNRACALVEELGAGEIVSGVIDVSHYDKTPVTLTLEPEPINRLLGTAISEADMRGYLTALGFPIDGATVTVPSYRGDVRRMADLAEEIARLYGYDKIPSTLASGSATAGGLTPRQKTEKLCESLCRSVGFSEIITYSFIGSGDYDRVRLPEDSPLRSSVKILNPLGEDRSLMRRTALPSLAEALARNYKNRNSKAWLYELARVYHPTDSDLPEEAKHLMLGAYGNTDFLDFKGRIEAVLSGLNLPEARFEPLTDNPAYHPGRAASLWIDGAEIGCFGELHPLLLSGHDIETAAYAAELNFEVILEKIRPEQTFKALPRFPAITRDIALICDRALPVGHLIDCVKSAAGALLESVELFDVYTGHQVDASQKSVALSLRLRSDTRTLQDEDAEKTVSAVLEALESAHGARLR